MLSEINALRRMSVPELQAAWMRLYGEPTRSRNKQFLWRRLAWRVQELAHGGLSANARARLDELAPDGFVRGRVPTAINVARQDRAEAANPPPPRRDPRLPVPGTTLTRQYRGTEIRVVTLEDGFEWDGRPFKSLSAVASAITGAKWNGKLFFGLTERKRSR